VQLTGGMSVVVQNSGTDVSHGLVTKPLNLIPAKDVPIHAARLKEPLTLAFNIDLERMLSAGWTERVLTLALEDGAEGFVEGVMVRGTPV
jgi:hypothetical protein